MKRLILSAFVLGTLFSAPAGLLLAGAANAQAGCGPDAPAAWQRPGGYCAQLGAGGAAGGSISDKSGGSEIVVVPEVECFPTSFRMLKAGDRLHMAATCDSDPYDCGSIDLQVFDLEVGDRLRVAC